MSAKKPHSLNKLGGNSPPVIVHNGIAYVSRQLPRRGDKLLYTGKAGAEVDLSMAQEAATFCADRCLEAISYTLGGDEKIVKVLPTQN